MSRLTERQPASTMRALVAGAGGVALRRVPAPESPEPGEVIVRVAVAGICRTDVRVARGDLGVRPVILGHECSGRIQARGGGVDLPIGTPVTIVPFQPCGVCAACRGDRCAGKARRGDGRCHDPRWLGLHRDGVFAELVRVPASCVRPVPPDMPMRLAAYVEPVAAALGALGAGFRPEAVVVIGGRNRIAELTERVLVAGGIAQVRRHDPDLDPPPPACSADVAIESTGAHGLDSLVAALRPGGVLILKSRLAGTIKIDPSPLVIRDLTVRGLGHGSFTQAIEWLHRKRLPVDDLLTPPRPLEDYASALADAAACETTKLFLAIDPAQG